MLKISRFIILFVAFSIPLSVLAVNEKKLTVVNLIESSENTLKVLDQNTDIKNFQKLISVKDKKKEVFVDEISEASLNFFFN